MKESDYKEIFQSLKIPEKLDFLGGGIIDSINEIDEKTLNVLLSNIILDANENGYVRKSGLELFTELVILGKLRRRHAFSLMLDGWSPSSDLFLELQRLKDLLLFYDTSDEASEEIESIFVKGLESSEAELIGESLFNLGIVSFVKALRSSNENDCKTTLSKSEHYFQKSFGEIENRVDSIFYYKVTLILQELLCNKWPSALLYIKELGNSLFQKEVYSFKFNFDNLQYQFYKILTSLQKICIQKPKEWIDYRLELDNIFLNYTEITNFKVVSRLNEKALIEKFGNYLHDKVLEPYFVMNFSSEQIKIDILLRDNIEGSPKFNFLQHLKTLIETSDKKKVEFGNLENSFKNLFPSHPPQQITEIIRDCSDPIDYVNAFEFFSKKDNEYLVKHLIFTCSKLQGDKNYWGKNVDENDRNRFIANMLESDGFTIKDQPQWSVSAKGQESGEIDVFITESDGTPKSIIEALNLDSLKQDYIILHLNKLFKYDVTGLENNYIIVYSLAKKFDVLWDKYRDFIQKHNYIYNFIDFEEPVISKFADIRIGTARHSRNGKEVNLHHIMINVAQR